MGRKRIAREQLSESSIPAFDAAVKFCAVGSAELPLNGTVSKVTMISDPTAELMFLVREDKTVFHTIPDSRGCNPVVGTWISSSGLIDRASASTSEVAESNSPSQPASLGAIFTDTSSGITLSDRLNPTHPAFDKDLKSRWKTLPKKQRQALIQQDRTAIETRHAAIASVKHPFLAVDDDHCETSLNAYADIAPLLEQLAGKLGKPKNELSIYDPYYCTGSVTKHLNSLGFATVYNRCEDFYKMIEDRKVPLHDVVVTNPAYSGDHCSKLLTFCVRNSKPFFLLMPNYIATSSEFRILERIPTAFLCPRKRYVYWTPSGLRTKKQAHSSAMGSRTSPFISFWYFHLGPYHDELLNWWSEHNPVSSKQSDVAAGKRSCMLARTLADLPSFVLETTADKSSKRSREYDAPTPKKKRKPQKGKHKKE